MDGLISRSKLIEFANNYFGGVIDCNDIARFPTIDAEPVRHGRWVKDKERNTYCSVCDCYIPAVHCRQDYQDDFSEWDEEIDETDYCPHCGSKMDAKEA